MSQVWSEICERRVGFNDDDGDDDNGGDVDSNDDGGDEVGMMKKIIWNN